EKYIPMSETHVITNQTKIIGFISMVEGYLAALFIDVAYQNNGAGKELLNFEKRRRNKIRLKVYKENLSAVRFYEKNGFIKIGRASCREREKKSEGGVCVKKQKHEEG